MKKKLIILSTLAISTLALCNCGKTENKDKTSETTVATTVDATEQAKETTEATAEAKASSADAASVQVEGIPSIVNATCSDAAVSMELYYNDGTKIAGRTDYSYDKNHNKKEVIAFCRDGVTPFRHVVYTYDDKNNCISEIAFKEADKDNKDAYEYEKTKEYNDAGLLIKETNNTSGTVTFNVYEYNSDNKVSKVTTSDTVTPCISYVVYTYNSDGNLESETTYDDKDVVSLKNEYIYQDGLLTKVNICSDDKMYGYRAYEYNDKKQKIKESVYFNDQLDHYEEFEYDSFGNVTKQNTVYKADDFSTTLYSY